MSYLIFTIYVSLCEQGTLIPKYITTPLLIFPWQYHQLYLPLNSLTICLSILSSGGSSIGDPVKGYAYTADMLQKEHTFIKLYMIIKISSVYTFS